MQVERGTNRISLLVVAVAIGLASLYAPYCSLLCEFGICPEEMLEQHADRSHEPLAPSRSELPQHSNCNKHGHSSSWLLPASDQALAGLGVLLHCDVVPAPLAHFFSPFCLTEPSIRMSHGPPGLLTGRQVCLRKSFLRI